MKNKKKILIISFLCFGAGVVILILGTLLGGRPGFYIDRDGIHSASEEPGYVRDEKMLTEFTRMEIDLDYTDLQIIPSDEYKIEYSLEGTDKPVYGVNNGTLEFKEAESNHKIGFMIISPFSNDHKKNYVKIYVPQNAAFKSIRIEEEDGDIRLPELKAETLDIVNEYGDVILDGLAGGNMTAELYDGKFSAHSLSVDQAIIENEYGNVNLEFSDKLKDYDLDLVTEYGSIYVPEYDVITGDDGSRCQVANPSGSSVKVFSEDGDIRVSGSK